MVQAQTPGLTLARDVRRDVDEQAFLFVWGEPHGRTLGNRGFADVTPAFRVCVGSHSPFRPALPAFPSRFPAKPAGSPMARPIRMRTCTEPRLGMPAKTRRVVPVKSR
ncbi:hypothetical protein Sme01_15850 [Sphaerisporangium melleum]|uniref:Uncharacterized protein n=1 Tax=Sphaerisporangium melleum TaxID=321316 RepID=A0A917RJM5_9ACTN|nr:hypothetical protein GCM10007964_61190 [Sphaerisporangium melleum]GII69109.1 hypothetical protein Sme01_15850 [Sphaerisporangium melleum]